MDDELEPPPYDGPERYDPSDMVQPAILVLAGRLVHAESSSSSSSSSSASAAAGSAAPLPLYELDHDVRFLSRAEHKVEFARHEPQVRMRMRMRERAGAAAPEPEPEATSHRRHLFNLECPHALTSTSPFAFFLTSVSRRTLGHVGLKKRRKGAVTAAAADFKVLRIGRRRTAAATAPGVAVVDEDDEGTLFEITRADGRHEWWDHDGRRVAIDDAADDGRRRIIVTTALPRQQVDALVATWCLRLWHDAALGQGSSLLSGVKRRLGIGYRG